VSLLLALALAAVQPGEPDLVEHSERADLLEFIYIWPDAVERDPALAGLLRERMEAARERVRTAARRSAQDARANGEEVRLYQFMQRWRLAGDSGGLLSLIAVVETFARGGHPEGDFETLLWDAAARRPVPVAELIGPMLPGLEQRYCASLDEARTERHGESVPPPGPEGSFALCPPLAEQVLVLEDANGSGGFDRLLVLIPPHAAAPDDDGPYMPAVDLEVADLARLPDRYRGAFEAVNDRRRPPPDE